MAMCLMNLSMSRYGAIVVSNTPSLSWLITSIQSPTARGGGSVSRVSGFHFKDTREVDTTQAYMNRPDAELMAPQTPRWFYEMGTEGGLVDFPRLMRALKEHEFAGWITVEHDKANIGGDYAESTALSMWYAKRVLSEIYS